MSKPDRFGITVGESEESLGDLGHSLLGATYLLNLRTIHNERYKGSIPTVGAVQHRNDGLLVFGRIARE